MDILIALFFGSLFIAAVAGPVIFLHARRILREQKDFERGLKMVPLLIHLPPPSDDTDVGQRDVRDVTDENISKAQILYSIMASTMQKSFKSKFYGQRHISLEIISAKGVIDFYAAVPISLVEVLKQAVFSAYPSARLEEVAEHNIFSSVGGISSTFGGELTLKENFAYPISTYQDIKRDPINSLLNSLSTLEKEDGAGIQLLIRPAEGGWRKKASALASKKRAGKEKSKGPEQLFSWASDLFGALVKPPEEKGGSGGSSDKQLSSLEETTLNAIDEKTKHPAFETTIRVITSSNVAQRSQSVLNNIVHSFALFDAPGKNGFKFTPAQDIEQFTTAYILRFFPAGHKKNILNSIELASLYHFPQQDNIPTAQLSRQDSKQVDGPRNMPEDGLLFGYNVFRGTKKPIRLALGDRQRHVYAVGQTGTGKSTFLENLALQDMINGDGFAFIDPHGDTAEKLLSMVPRERTEDVIYFCPAETDYPMGLNVFESKTDDEKDFVIQEVINVLYKLYDPQRQGIIGPRYEHLFRMSALTVMSGPEGGSFIDIPKLFTDDDYVAQKLKYVTDQNVLDFWQKEMARAKKSNEFGDVVSWFVSKFGAFLSNGMMRNIIGQIQSSFDLRDIMDNKKILLVNLSKGRTGDMNSKLLGMIFVMRFQAAAMSRANVPEDDRQDFCLYVDEFQNFSTDSFATIMSEARKYHLNLVVANQFTTQLTEEIRDAVFGNMGTIVSFRIGQNDVEALSRYFQPTFDGDDLVRIPNHNAIVRTLVGGVPTQPFSMTTLPPLGTPNSELGDALKQLSAAKYGRPRQVVEKEIFARLKTQERPKPAFGQSPFGAAGTPAPFGQTGNPAPAFGSNTPTPSPAPNPSASFLDQWLEKRQKPPVTQKPSVASQPSAAAFGGSNNSYSAARAPGGGQQPQRPQQYQSPAVSTPPTAFASSSPPQTNPLPPKEPEPDTKNDDITVQDPNAVDTIPQQKTSESHPVGELKITRDTSPNAANSQEDMVQINRPDNLTNTPATS